MTVSDMYISTGDDQYMEVSRAWEAAIKLGYCKGHRFGRSDIVLPFPNIEGSTYARKSSVQCAGQ